jgi:hypothetical protein
MEWNTQDDYKDEACLKNMLTFEIWSAYGGKFHDYSFLEYGALLPAK